MLMSPDLERRCCVPSMQYKLETPEPDHLSIDPKPFSSCGLQNTAGNTSGRPSSCKTNLVLFRNWNYTQPAEKSCVWCRDLPWLSVLLLLSLMASGWLLSTLGQQGSGASFPLFLLVLAEAMRKDPEVRGFHSEYRTYHCMPMMSDSFNVSVGLWSPKL